MFVNLAKTASKAAIVAVAAVGLLAVAGGWAFAGLGPGHQTGHGGIQMSPTFVNAGSVLAASPANGAQSAGPQAGSALASQSKDTEPEVRLTLPAGLLPATSQSLADLKPTGGSSPSGHSATGGGSTSSFQFGFTAQSHRNGNVAGTVTGNAEIQFGSPSPGHLHINVNCLEIRGTDAFVSGVLTNSAFGLTKGTEMLFGVRDDDSASKPDLISDIFFSPAPPFTCHTFHAPPHFAVQGNIEIH